MRPELNWQALDCRQLPDAVTVKVRVQPRASRNAVTGIAGDSLKLALTAPPVEGAANAACCAFLADLCGVAKTRVAVVGGHKSRDKLVRIGGLDKGGFLAVVAAKVAFD
jgi:uncharacterized protein (TIGR00251 family)